MNPMRMRANVQGDAVVVRVLITHPEDTGLVKGVPAHFIQSVTCKLNDKVVMEADWGTSVSKNPFLQFSVKGGKAGDTITVTWLDNLGQTQTSTATVA